MATYHSTIIDAHDYIEKPSLSQFDTPCLLPTSPTRIGEAEKQVEGPPKTIISLPPAKSRGPKRRQICVRIPNTSSRSLISPQLSWLAQLYLISQCLGVSQRSFAVISSSTRRQNRSLGGQAAFLFLFFSVSPFRPFRLFVIYGIGICYVTRSMMGECWKRRWRRGQIPLFFFLFFFCCMVGRSGLARAERGRVGDRGCKCA
jgi:hypothetical protein